MPPVVELALPLMYSWLYCDEDLHTAPGFSRQNHVMLPSKPGAGQLCIHRSSFSLKARQT